MGQRYTFNYLWIILIAVLLSVNLLYALPCKAANKVDSILFKRTRTNSKIYKTAVSSGLVPEFKPVAIFKPTIYTSAKNAPPREDDKLLSNVQIYPNPITDQINLRYTISRNSNVTIKIMDVLGNNVATLFSQRVDPGERKFTHYLNNRLTSGFYFLRVMVGTESVIKRITVL